MSVDMDQKWADVAEALQSADSIAWDTCHKIYVLMDNEQTLLMREYEYDPLILIRTDGTKLAMTPEQALKKLQDWWDESCGLRFINAVRTTPDANADFTNLIAQFEDCDDDEQDEDEL